MKVRNKIEVPKAARIFTDREEPRKSFWKNYDYIKQHMQNDCDIRVLAYYGIGGIGKSTLLQKLISEMEVTLTESRVATFDFNIAQDSRTALEQLKNQLVTKYKFRFPLFELGLYKYAMKIGENMEAPEIKSLVEKSPFLNVVLDAMGVIPTVNVVPAFFKLADRGMTYLRNVVNKHKQDLTQIEYKDPAALYEYLTCLFAKDLTDNLKETTVPLVIMFDTYERLVNEMTAVGEPLNNDLWIRGPEGLVQNIPNVLWVIAGREKLKWERFDADWKEAIESHILGNLTRNDATAFLHSAGIGDNLLRNELYDLTQGTPVYLDLCVDRFVALLEKGRVPVINDFGNDVYSLIEHFARYMDDNKKDIVYLLSCLRQWNDVMLVEVAQQVLPGFSLTTYEKVKDFSFVNETDENTYSIHQTVGEALYQNCPSIVKTKTEKCAIEFCKKAMQNSSVFSTDYLYYLQWLMKYTLSIYDDDDQLRKFYENNIKKPLDKLSVAGQFSAVNRIFSPFLERAEKTNNVKLYASALNSFSYFLSNAGNYQYASEMSAKALAALKSIYDETDLNVLEAQLSYANRLEKECCYQEAYEIIMRAYRISENLLGNNHPRTLAIMNNLGILLTDMGKYIEALDIYDEIFDKLLHTENEYKSEGLKNDDNLNCTVNKGAHFDKYISVINNAANTLCCLEFYEDALTLYRIVLDDYSDKFGDDHPNTIQAMRNYAITLSDLEQYDLAIPMLAKALEKSRITVGENHPDTIGIMNNLASAISSNDLVEDAIPIQRDVISKYKTILGENHRDTITAINSLAKLFFSLKNYEKALQLGKQVLEKRNLLLGENHPDTVNSLHDIANFYSASGYKDKALDCFEKALEKKKNLLGENHPDTIYAINDLAWHYHINKEPEKGLPYARAVDDKINTKNFNNKMAIINCWDTLAWLLLDIEKYQEACEVAKRAVNYAEKLYPQRKRFLADRYFVAGIALEKCHNYQDALVNMQKAYEIRKGYMKEDNNELIDTEKHLVVIKDALKANP